MCSVQAFPFLDRHGCGCYSSPYQLFYADPKVEENIYTMGKVGVIVKIGRYHALKVVESRFLISGI